MPDHKIEHVLKTPQGREEENDSQNFYQNGCLNFYTKFVIGINLVSQCIERNFNSIDFYPS